MHNLFNMENPTMQLLSKIADMVILNLLFVLFSLPIVSIGASFTALFSVTFKMTKEEGTPICKTFWQAFLSNFKQSTLLWIGIAVLGVILSLNLRFALADGSVAGNLLKIATLLAAIAFFMVVQYLFPYVARFQDKTAVVIKNCLLLALAHLPGTVCCGLIVIVPIFLSFTSMSSLWFAIFAWTVIGISGIAYINSQIFLRIFAQYEPGDTKKSSNVTEEEG